MTAKSAATEQRVLLESTLLTAALAIFGVVLGLISGSMAIVFDGLFSVIDLAMALLALWVARLVVRESDRKFQYGYWHIEPMALAFNGGMLILLCIYAFVNAVGSLLDGGQAVQVGWALGYSAIVSVISVGMYLYERAVNRKVDSSLLGLDIQSWFMTAIAAVALLAAFAVAWALGATEYAQFAPLIDPAILAVLSLVLAVLPVRTVQQALREILLIAPTELDDTVHQVMDAIVERHGFSGFTSYSARVGRGQFIEIHILVPGAQSLGTVDEIDAIRDEIADALGIDVSEHWLTVDFTATEKWT